MPVGSRDKPVISTVAPLNVLLIDRAVHDGIIAGDIGA